MAKRHDPSQPGGFDRTNALLGEEAPADYAGRILSLVAAAADWDRRAFYRAAASEAPGAAGEPWGWEAGPSFFDALETALNGQRPAGGPHEAWERAA